MGRTSCTSWPPRPSGGSTVAAALLIFHVDSSDESIWTLCSAPFLHCAVPRWRPLSAFLGTCRSHRGHRGWGRLPSSSSTTVSWTCRCTKCTRIAVLVTSAPGHPSTGQRRAPPSPGRTSCTSCSPRPSGGSTVAAALLLFHVESSDDSTWTRSRETPHTPRMLPSPAVSPRMTSPAL